MHLINRLCHKALRAKQDLTCSPSKRSCSLLEEHHGIFLCVLWRNGDVHNSHPFPSVVIITLQKYDTSRPYNIWNRALGSVTVGPLIQIVDGV